MLFLSQLILVVLNHLLFHKAMVGIDTEKIDQYIEIADSASSAAEVATG